MRAALVQLNSSDSPEDNLPVTRDLICRAAGQGARLILTPEVTNCVSLDRAYQQEVLRHETDDRTLAALRGDARALGVWILIGSLALRTDDPDGRFANRSFLIAPDGEIRARYDKIHMFDVSISAAETFRESSGYRPGDRAVTADLDRTVIGMSVCYDLRFAQLYRRLAQAGARILCVPSAFSPVTGAAHWETLLRARAIETGSFVLAPAQTGTHIASRGAARQTYGHSLAVSPWGEVLADAGEAPGITVVDLDLDQADKCRERIPALHHDRAYQGP